MATTVCFIIWVLFTTDTVWTQSVRQAYEVREPEDWDVDDYDCPRECFCPPSFPTALYCENRGLKEIPAIPSRIRYLYLENNLIETIPEKPFENATQLRWINLNKNKITNRGIEKGALSQLKKLLFLFLEDNELEEVPAPLPRSLEQLQLARNKVSKIPQGTFSNLENLTLLDLQHNKLLDNAFQRDTFKGLKNLMQLNMAKNALRNMPPRLPANTMQLFLDNNSIEGIPENYFNVIPKVAFLRLNYNRLSDTGLPSRGFDASSILELQLSHNRLTKFPRISAFLQHLHLDHNKIKSRRTPFHDDSTPANMVNIPKTRQTCCKKCGKHQPHKSDPVQEGKGLCMPRESSIMTESRVATKCSLSLYSRKRLRLRRRLC